MSKNKSNELTSLTDEDLTDIEGSTSTSSFGGEEIVLSQNEIKKNQFYLEIQNLNHKIESRNSTVNQHKREIHDHKQKLQLINEKIWTIETEIQVYKEKIHLDSFKQNLAYTQNLLKPLVSESTLGKWWYNIKQTVMNTFGFKTSQQIVKNSIQFYQTKIQAAEEDYNRYSTQKNLLLLPLKDQAKTIEETLDSLQSKIQALSVEKMLQKVASLKQQLTHLDDQKLKKELIKGCKIKFKMGIKYDLENFDSKTVKTHLRHFLLKPTQNHLIQLQQSMITHPNFRTNEKLNQVLLKTQELYPEISPPPEEWVPIRDEKAKILIEKQIVSNRIKIENNEEKMTYLQANYEKNMELLQQKKNQIQSNQNTLISYYRLLFVAERRKVAAQHQNKKTEEEATNKIIVFIMEKIREVSLFIPDAQSYNFKNLREVAILDYECARDEIEEILAEYDILLLEEEHLNFTTIQNLIAELPEQELILECINQIPAISQQIREGEEIIYQYVEKLEDVVIEIAELEQVKILKQESALDAIDMITAVFNQLMQKQHAKPEEKILDKAMTQYSQMIEKFGVRFYKENNPQKALQKYLRDVKQLHPFIKTKLDSVLNAQIPIIENALTTPLSGLEKQFKIIPDAQLSGQNFCPFEIQCQQQKHQIEHLISETVLLKDENVQLKNGIQKDLYSHSQDMLELIKACKKKPMLNADNPVRIKLKEFLTNPTPIRLQILLETMQTHSEYQKNKVVLPLIERASEFYLEIANKHQALLSLQTSHSLSEFKQEITSARKEPNPQNVQRNPF